MGKKKKDKLGKKLDKLNSKMYGNKRISDEEILIHKFTKEIKEYYNSISSDRQKAFVAYILANEKKKEFELIGLNKIEDDEDIEVVKPKKCKSLSDAIDEKTKCIKKNKKSSKKSKSKRTLEIEDGLLALVNPGICDSTLLGKKKYRKMIRELSEKDKENEVIELDCTLKSFKKELKNNPKVNQAVSDAFFNKYGIHY